MVILMSLCPSNSCTTFRGAPALTRLDANEWRKSWIRMREVLFFQPFVKSVIHSLIGLSVLVGQHQATDMPGILFQRVLHPLIHGNNSVFVVFGLTDRNFTLPKIHVGPFQVEHLRLAHAGMSRY